MPDRDKAGRPVAGFAPSRRGRPGAGAAGLGLVASSAADAQSRATIEAGTADLADADLFSEMFKAPVSRDVSLNDWIAASPPELVGRHLRRSGETPAAMPENNLGIVPPGRG